MILSYFKTAVRNILRNKLFSFINVIGLATSMSAGLLLIAIVHDMYQYDSFHLKKDKIYRVINDYEDQNGNSYSMATSSIKAGKRIREEFPGVENVTILQHGFSGDFKVESHTVPLKGFWADAEFFKVFSFELLRGNRETALQQPYSVLLTENAAQKLFGTLDVLGKPVLLHKNEEENFIVTGVTKNVPKFSHLQFEVLGSLSTIELAERENQSYWSWENIWSNYVYLTVADGSSSQNVQSSLDQLSNEENKLSNNFSVSLKLQALKDIALGKSLENQPGPVMSSKLIWSLTGLSLLVLISACFNYTNLSIARALKRAKEMGIRKMIGAKKRQLFFQFVSESVVLSLASLFIALALFQSIRPVFLTLNPRFSNLLNINLSIEVVLYFILFALVIGLLAGFLPGLFYSKIQIINAVKNFSSTNLAGKLRMRKVLMVVQYTLSFVFVTSVVILYSQYEHFINYDLGFTTKNILNIKVQDVKAETLQQSLNNIPDILQTSKSFMITSVGNNYYTHVKYTNPLDSLRAWYNKIDEHYIPLFELKFLAGRNFSNRPDGAPESEVIVNEQLIKNLNIGGGNPNAAVGEFVTIDGVNLQIIGVLSDFHYSTLSRAIGPFLFRNISDSYNFINVKFASNNFTETLRQIEVSWKKTGSAHPFDAYFYDELIQRAYGEYSSMMKAIGYLAFLTVIIASLGLIGIVVYSTQSRISEISIRKVFGARATQLMIMLSSDFIKLLALALLIAIPITYFIFSKIVLSGEVYRAPIGLFELAFGSFSVLIIAVILISIQTLKIATTNPAESLRSE